MNNFTTTMPNGCELQISFKCPPPETTATTATVPEAVTTMDTSSTAAVVGETTSEYEIDMEDFQEPIEEWVDDPNQYEMEDLKLEKGWVVDSDPEWENDSDDDDEEEDCPSCNAQIYQPGVAGFDPETLRWRDENGQFSKPPDTAPKCTLVTENVPNEYDDGEEERHTLLCDPGIHEKMLQAQEQGEFLVVD